jgi:phage I-like protein
MNARTINALALCRVASAEAGAAAASDPWLQMVPPPGDYRLTITKAGKQLQGQTLTITPADLDAIQVAFRQDVPDDSAPGLLVDREHLSLQPSGDSTALGWIKALRLEADGSLYARVALTPEGRAAHDGRLYLYRSPVLDLEPAGSNRWRPTRLAGAAMTNMPQFDCLSPAALAARAAGANKETPTMTLFEKLRALLALPEDADEDACYAEVEKRLGAGAKAGEDLAQAQARVQSLESADLDRQADAFLAEHAARIQDKDAVRAQFRKDPTGCRAIFGACRQPAAEPAARVLAREQARSPGDRDAAAPVADELTSRRHAAVAAMVASDGISHREAMAICRHRSPELFAAG